MTGPVNINPRRAAMGSLDDLTSVGGKQGWDALEAAFLPALTGQGLRPDERIMRFLAAMAQTEDGRAFVDWLFDLTCRAPYPRTGGDRDELAFAAAKHQARAAVGDVIAAALVEGRRLIDQGATQGARR